MRRWLYLLTIFSLPLLMTGCVLDIYSKQVESESDREAHEFATRLDAASAVGDASKRDDSLGRVVRDAARRGRVGVVKNGLSKMSAVDKKDAAAADAALSLAGVHTGEDAVPAARLITDQTLRDDTLSKIAAQLKRD
jgi:hypothetical protein